MLRPSSHWRQRAYQSDKDFIYIQKTPKISPIQPEPTKESSPLESPKPIMIFEFDKVSSKEKKELETVFEEIESWCFSLRFSTGGEMLYELGKLAPPPLFEGTPRPNREIKAMKDLFESRFSQIVTESVNIQKSQPLNASTAQQLNTSTPQPLVTPNSTPINPSTPLPFTTSKCQPINPSTLLPLTTPKSSAISFHKSQLINPSTTVFSNTQKSIDIKPSTPQPSQQTIQEEDNEDEEENEDREEEEEGEEHLPTTFKSKLINPVVFRFNPFPFEHFQPQPALNPTYYPGAPETPPSPISQTSEPNEPEELSYYNKKIIENSKIAVSPPLCLPYVILQPYWLNKPANRPPLKSSSKPFFQCIESSTLKSLAFPLFEPENTVRVKSQTVELSPNRNEVETVSQKLSKPAHLSIPKRIKYPTPRRINRQAPKRPNHLPIKSTNNNRQHTNPSTPQQFNTSTAQQLNSSTAQQFNLSRLKGNHPQSLKAFSA